MKKTPKLPVGDVPDQDLEIRGHGVEKREDPGPRIERIERIERGKGDLEGECKFCSVQRLLFCLIQYKCYLEN